MPKPSSIRSSKRAQGPAREDLSLDSLLESCEQRLVLSAQLIADALQDYGDASNASGNVPIETHLAQAHQTTGLSAVAEQFGLDGTGQTVAVIDSGIAWDHVALGQGYGPGYRIVGGWDFAENDAQPYDDGPAGFHGTHVAGVIGSDQPDSPGVAPGVDLVSLRVFNDAGQGQLDWVESALQWIQEHRNAFENPITTVNISVGALGTGDASDWSPIEDELQQLYESGVVVTASAGNSFATLQNTDISYPASSPFTLAVTSVDADGSLSEFGQRNPEVLGAPGAGISSSVPDHVLGRDGVIDDFASASGTSMASPYVAGASVLVRQAMEMAGHQEIDTGSIVEHLRSSSDSVYDTLTGQNYQSLNLQQAISEILPTDDIGDNSASASTISIGDSAEVTTWINSLQDEDRYQFSTEQSGLLTLDIDSEWVDSVQWTLLMDGQTVEQGGSEGDALTLEANRDYELSVAADGTIGPLTLALGFEPVENQGGDLVTPPVDLGVIDYWTETATPNEVYSVTARQDGILTFQWSNPQSEGGTLVVRDAAGQTFTDATWTDNTTRIDVNVQTGQVLEVTLISESSSEQGDLTLANVVEQTGDAVEITGTHSGDSLELDLRNGVSFQIGTVAYQFESAISSILIDGQGAADSIDVVGSRQIERVQLTPTESSFANPQVQVSVLNVENVDFESGGGTDRVYLYDSDGDDILRAHPGQAELTGVGYRYHVQGVERIFIHATGAGVDFAYLYDSAGDDRISARPQFTSLQGDGFFNYVQGFERVYAVANAGGLDRAELYDSSGNDRFITNGDSASMVGSGYASYLRSFEEVEGHAIAGGQDLAMLYGSDSQTRWQNSENSVSFQEGQWYREAIGFNEFLAFNDGTSIDLQTLSLPESQTWSNGPQALTEDVLRIDIPQESSLHATNPLTNYEGAREFLREAILLESTLDSKFRLPEEAILQDAILEREILHRAFEQYGAQFD